MCVCQRLTRIPRMLLCAVVVTLLVASVEAASISGGSPGNYNYDLSGSALTQLYNQRVVNAELMRRPLSGLSRTYGPLSHSGVRVTLGDGSQYLIHKGGGFGLEGGDTVVTDARHMSSAWETSRSRVFGGSKTVADFVEAGGSDYNLIFDNCHIAAKRLMCQ